MMSTVSGVLSKQSDVSLTIIGFCKVRLNALLKRWSRETCPGEVSRYHHMGLTSASLAIGELTYHIEGNNDKLAMSSCS